MPSKDPPKLFASVSAQNYHVCFHAESQHNLQSELGKEEVEIIKNVIFTPWSFHCEA